MLHGGTTRSRSSTRRYEALLELAAMDKADFEGALRRILATDAQLLEVERVNCWQFVANPIGLRCVSGYRRSEEKFETGASLAAADCRRYFDALTNDPVILADDAQSDTRTNELRDHYLEPRGITSLMDVPVWVRGALWGVVCHEHVGPPRRWWQWDRDFATSIGHIVSMAVEARERAAAEERVRGSEFLVGTLGHDLRNPLSSIRGSAELLRRSEDSSTARSAERILRSSDRMTRLIDQLLDWTRIRMGSGMPLRRAPTNIEDVSEQVAADLRETHPDAAITLSATGDTRGQWDPDRVWQVLSNLVCNAVEHGTPGEPVWIFINGGDPARLDIEVGNRGPIAPSAAAAALQPLEQLRANPRTKGLGLGLLITREIIAAHNGTMSIDRHPEQTIFNVSLPRTPS